MKTRYPCSEGIITPEESHIYVDRMSRNQLDSSGGFNDTVGIALSGRQNDEKLRNGSRVVFNQESHESNFQTSKRPNIRFVHARHLWGEGLMIIGENHFSAATLTNRGSVDSR